jgi:hypothetical protein
MPKSAVELRHLVLNLSDARKCFSSCRMLPVEAVAQHIWNFFLMAHAPTLEHLDVTACSSFLPESACFIKLRSVVLVLKNNHGLDSSTTSLQESGVWSSLPVVAPNLSKN